MGERNEDRKESESILSKLDSYSEKDLDLLFEEVQEELSGAPRRYAKIKNSSKPSEETIIYNPFQGLLKPNVLKAQFSASQVTKSNRHMVKILVMLSHGSDTSDSDQPLFLDEAMASLHWSHWKSAIHKEYQSLMKDETWTLIDSPFDRKMITGRWIYKLEKN